MKLYIPEGPEKSERNEKLSPTIGQPRLPGMSSIDLGEAMRYINRKANSSNTEKITNIRRMLSSISHV